jgi:hypothetical protein
VILSPLKLPGELRPLGLAFEASTNQILVIASDQALYAADADDASTDTLTHFMDLTEGGGTAALDGAGHLFTLGTGRVAVYDVRAKKSLGAVAAPPGAFLSGIAVASGNTPDHGDAYVTDTGTNQIYHVSLDGTAVALETFVIPEVIIEPCEVSPVNLSGLFVTPDDRALIVGHIVERYLYRYDLAARTWTQLKTGINRSPGALRLDGKKMYLAAEFDQSVPILQWNDDFISAELLDELVDGIRSGDSDLVKITGNRLLLIDGLAGGFGGLLGGPGAGGGGPAGGGGLAGGGAGGGPGISVSSGPESRTITRIQLPARL